MHSFLDGKKDIKDLEPIKIVGNGTFGLVYKCYDKALKRKVAVKKLFWNSSPLLIYNEIESLINFTRNHCRNVLKLLNIYRCKDMVFIETEYHHHQSISTYLHTMTNNDIFLYMKDLLTALCDIHALGYIHCDVKPGNFLFDIYKKKGFLCDFGLCEKQRNNKITLPKRINTKNAKEKDVEEDNDTKDEWFEFNFDYLERDIKTESSSFSRTIKNYERCKVVKQDSQGCTVHIDIPLKNYNNNESSISDQEIEQSECTNDIEDNRDDSNLDDLSYESDDYFDMIDSRETMRARRGGTRGYRAPEVLWKMENQTSAIDIWSAGMIFLTLLSKQNPFLSGKDDLTDLYEIGCIVGRERLQFEALMCGKFIALPDNGQKECTIKELVEKLNPSIHDMKVPESAFDLLEKMLDPSPRKRISAKKCLEHPYFSS